MVSLGSRNYVVFKLPIGGTKISNIKVVLQREPRTGITWFSIRFVLPNKEPVDAAVHELFEETCLTLTIDDFTMLSNKPVRVSLPKGKHELVYVYSAYVPVSNVMPNLRTPAKVSQDATTQSTISPNGTYVVPKSIDIDGLSLTPSKTELLPHAQRRFQLLHFGYVTQLEAFRGVVISKQMFSNEDTSLPRLLLLWPRFTHGDSGFVRMLIKRYIYLLCGETPTDLRMGVPAPTTILP
jgi:ADP-ribose pyrophosphatase YjhB (NUDIX family)